METYIDGYLLAVAATQLPAYKAMAKTAAVVWKEHGALSYQECAGDDLDHPAFASFRHAAGAQDGEVVIFAWIIFPNKEQRDKTNAKVMADPRLTEMCHEGIFDAKRMAWGGFKSLVSA